MKLLGIALLLVAACGRTANANPDPDLAGETAEVVSGLPLDQVLAELEAKLDSVLAEGSGGGSIRRLSEAESMTDHLVETELPFAWLGEDGYSVQARLRQIQSMADRVMALTRGGMDRTVLDRDVHTFRDQVHGLREDLARGGGPAPAPVADLLRVMDSIR